VEVIAYPIHLIYAVRIDDLGQRPLCNLNKSRMVYSLPTKVHLNIPVDYHGLVGVVKFYAVIVLKVSKLLV